METLNFITPGELARRGGLAEVHVGDRINRGELTPDALVESAGRREPAFALERVALHLAALRLGAEVVS